MRLTFEYELDDPRQSGFIAALKERYARFVDNEHPDIVVVVGGDGAMLRALHRRTPPPGEPARPIRFLGVGRGNLNFLMNPSSVADQLAELDPAAMPCHRVHPLWVEANGELIGAAYNDVVIGAGVADCHEFHLDSPDGEFEGYELRGTGICVSTPLGSTAFNANNRGAVLPLDVPLLSITGIVSNRDLSEIFAGSDLSIRFDSRRGVTVFLDAHNARHLDRSGVVRVRRDETRWMELTFVNDGEFSRRRIDLLKGKRK
ncbi:MAG TPA: hypothetical protein VD860_15660 [Azospirillum sp.]|nr:hypothetical protein [Azospirillum sp.]